jgi:hypothetical protein
VEASQGSISFSASLDCNIVTNWSEAIFRVCDCKKSGKMTYAQENSRFCQRREGGKKLKFLASGFKKYVLKWQEAE